MATKIQALLPIKSMKATQISKENLLKNKLVQRKLEQAPVMESKPNTLKCFKNKLQLWNPRSNCLKTRKLTRKTKLLAMKHCWEMEFLWMSTFWVLKINITKKNKAWEHNDNLKKMKLHIMVKGMIRRNDRLIIWSVKVKLWRQNFNKVSSIMKRKAETWKILFILNNTTKQWCSKTAK